MLLVWCGHRPALGSAFQVGPGQVLGECYWLEGIPQQNDVLLHLLHSKLNYLP